MADSAHLTGCSHPCRGGGRLPAVSAHRSAVSAHASAASAYPRLFPPISQGDLSCSHSCVGRLSAVSAHPRLFLPTLGCFRPPSAVSAHPWPFSPVSAAIIPQSRLSRHQLDPASSRRGHFTHNRIKRTPHSRWGGAMAMKPHSAHSGFSHR